MTQADSWSENSSPRRDFPLRIVLTSVEYRREVVRDIRSRYRTIPIDRLAWLFSISTSTAYRDLALYGPESHDRDSMIEAGLAWLTRHDTLPDSASWNSTHALEHARGVRRFDGGVAWNRWIEEYRPRSDPSVLRPWPATAAVTNEFGSFRAFRAAVARERQLLTARGTPYEAVPLDPEHVVHCKMRAAFPWGAPENVPHVHLTDWFESVDGVLALLFGTGELELIDAYTRAAANRDATELRWPPPAVPQRRAWSS
jgi:hypothetical protein